MPYIRHRPRMVRQSVYEDLKALLVSLNWMPDPDHDGSRDDLLGLLSTEVVLTDYYPVNAAYQGEDIALNTLALDQGTPEEPEFVEMGSNAQTQQYLFNFALFAESDAVAMSLFSDLGDRYRGRDPDFNESVALYNYLEATPGWVVDMEVDSFQVTKSPQQPAPGRMLWFAQLIVEDYLEATE